MDELTPEELELKAEDERLAKELQGEIQPEEANNTKEEEDEDKTDDADDSTEEPDEEPDEEDEVKTRQPKVPYRKFKAEREKRQELESTINDLKADIEAIKNSSKSNADKKDDIEELANEYGVDPTFAKKLAENIAGKAKSPLSEEEIADWKKDREIKAQNEEFDKEFSELLEVEPNAKEHKDALKKLAFSKYGSDNFKSLFYIFGKEIKPNLGKKKTAETTSNKRTDNTVLDYKNMSEEDALKLPPEQFLEWSDYQMTNK